MNVHRTEFRSIQLAHFFVLLTDPIVTVIALVGSEERFILLLLFLLLLILILVASADLIVLFILGHQSSSVILFNDANASESVKLFIGGCLHLLLLPHPCPYRRRTIRPNQHPHPHPVNEINVNDRTDTKYNTVI